MAIAFVNGTVTATTATAGSTLATVTYASTAGNIVAVSLAVPNTVTGVTAHDNNNNSLTFNPTTQTAIYQLYGTAVSGATAYTLSWTTTRLWSAAVAEYSGAAGIGGTVQNAASAGTVTQTLLTTAPNDFLVASFCTPGVATQTYAAILGSLRGQSSAGTHNLAIMDNTAAAQGATVTTTAAQTTVTAWQAAGFELLSTIAASGNIQNWLSKQKASGVNKHS